MRQFARLRLYLGSPLHGKLLRFFCRPFIHRLRCHPHCARRSLNRSQREIVCHQRRLRKACSANTLGTSMLTAPRLRLATQTQTSAITPITPCVPAAQQRLCQALAASRSAQVTWTVRPSLVGTIRSVSATTESQIAQRFIRRSPTAQLRHGH